MASGHFASAQAGRVSIIGLDQVKEKFGADWQRLSVRADRLVRNTIQKYLTPGDIFTSFADTNYLIVFAGLDTEQARMKCLLVADEVLKALLGEQGRELITIGTAVARLDGKSGIAEILSPSCPLDHHPPTFAAPGSSRDAELAFVDSDNISENGRDQPRVVFQPMWDVANGVLSTFMAEIFDDGLPKWQDLDGRVVTIAERDHVLQERVLAELANSSKALIGLSLHFETLASVARRRQYVERLRRALSPEQAKFLVIEIDGVPSGVPQSRMHELITPLIGHCHAVVARAPLAASDLSQFRRTGIAAIGCEIPAHPASELTLIHLMSRFSRSAENIQLPAYVRALRSKSLTTAAIGAGFRYVEGAGIGEIVEHPSAVRFNLRDLYRSLLGRV